jgi:hypothetical protein
MERSTLILVAALTLAFSTPLSLSARQVRVGRLRVPGDHPPDADREATSE